MQPRTLWERNDEAANGSRLGIRAAAFDVNGSARGAVLVTARVPAEMGHVVDEDGSLVVTLLLDPVEAEGLANLMLEAVDEAQKVGPGLYGG